MEKRYSDGEIGAARREQRAFAERHNYWDSGWKLYVWFALQLAIPNYYRLSD